MYLFSPLISCYIILVQIEIWIYESFKTHQLVFSFKAKAIMQHDLLKRILWKKRSKCKAEAIFLHTHLSEKCENISYIES